MQTRCKNLRGRNVGILPGRATAHPAPHGVNSPLSGGQNYDKILNFLAFKKGDRAINIKQGTHIHHPQHGVGKVESIRKRSFYGQAAATYAQLYFEREELTLTLLAKDVSDTIRTVITADEAENLLDSIKDWNGAPKKQWKARADAHQAAIESGDPLECAKVLKGLNRLQSEGPLRQQDRAHLKQSMELLTDELARALKKRRPQARKLLIEAIDD